MKKMLKIFTLFVIIILSISAIAYAGFIPDELNPDLQIGGKDKVQNITTNIIGTMIWIGYAIAIGAVIFVGVKYTIASADERASIKGMLLKIIIGSCIIFLATVIVDIAISIFKIN